MGRRTPRFPLLAAGIMLGTACAEEVAPIAFDAATSTTTPPTVSPRTTMTSTTTLPAGSVDDVGETWLDATGNLAGLSSECGNLAHVSARPDDGGGVIAGVALQGLWSSADNGQTWTELGQGAESAHLEFRPTAIQYDPDQPQRFWASGLYDSGGIYVTDDGGATFRQLLAHWNTIGVGVDLTDPQRLTLLAAIEPMELRLSVDGGETWEVVSDVLPDEGGRIVSVMAIDAETFVVGTRDGRVPGIFRTTDGGATWTRVHPVGVAGAPVRATNGKIYWLQERGGGLLNSADEGATWTLADGPGISPFAADLVELPDGRLVTVSDDTLIGSDDEGEQWLPIGPPLPYEPTGLTFSAADNAMFISRYDCDFGSDNPIRSGAIMRLDFAVGATSSA